MTWRRNLPTWRYCQFFDTFTFLLSLLVVSPTLMSVSLLVLELWQFLFIRDLTRNLEIKITLVWVCPIPNFAWMSLMKRYLMLQNTRFTVYDAWVFKRGREEDCKNTPSYIRVSKNSNTNTATDPSFEREGEDLPSFQFLRASKSPAHVWVRKLE